MSFYYEDTMPLVTNEDEYLKYFIDESLPLFDRLNIIIKKGQPFQRQALLNNLNIYIKSSLLKPLIQFIISEIETWDIETVLLFPKCLHNLLIKYLSSLDNELFNIIFKHIIISISSGNEKLSKEYIYYFEIVIVYYTKEFNNNNGKKFPFIIGDDIYEIIFSLGKFGQSPENIRLCCYLASCMCRIMGNGEENENIQKMFNRICLLFCDLEKTTETQISRELHYLIPIFKDKILEKNDIIQAIKSYINNDSDHAIQTNTIISLLVNIKYISSELKELAIEKIKEIFDDNNYEDENKNNILDTIINSLYNQCLQYESKSDENDKENKKECDKDVIHEIVNKILQMNFMQNFLNNEKIEPLLINNFVKISLILKNCTLYNNCYVYCTNCEEGMITIDDIFIKIYLKLFSKNAGSTNTNTSNNNNIINININTNTNGNSAIEESSNEHLKKLFIINLYKIIPCLIHLKNSKCLYEKLNNLFKKDSIISVLKKYEEEYSTNNCQKNYNYLYKFLLCLLEQSQTIYNNNNTNKIICINNNSNNNTNPNNISINENYYIKLFHNILGNIFSSYTHSPNLFTNQIHFLVAKTLQKIIKQIFKYHKSFSQNIKDKNSIDKIYDEIFNNYLFNIIKNSNLGNYIKVEYIYIFPYLILYGKNRQIYLNFIEDEIIKSPEFYTRRYCINFIEKCLSIYSFNLFIKFNLLDIVYNLINDENNIISASIIEKILFFYKKIIFTSNDVFQNICKTLSKINKLNKDNKSVSIKNFDIEKNRTIKKILNLNINNNENNKNSDININNNKPIENLEIKEEFKKVKEKEAKLILKETEIFGKGYQTISLFTGFTRKNLTNEIKVDKNSTNNENKNWENKGGGEENITQFKSTHKEKNNKRKLWIEKSSSGVMQNLSSKNSSKKYLPKIKYNSRKQSSSNNRQCDITFNNNIINNSNINKINSNSKTLNINKLIINFKDKSPEKKGNLKSINHHRLPSANSSKIRESLPLSSITSNLNGKNIFYHKYGNNLYIDDNNIQILDINENNYANNIMRHSGRIVIKELINSNEFSNNNVFNGSKSINSSKNINIHFKNGIRGMKMKKDNLFNISNKITINAKTNEINKSSK